MNPEDNGRRKVLKGALSASVLAAGAATAPTLFFPALAQGERFSSLSLMSSPRLSNGIQFSRIPPIGRILDKLTAISPTMMNFT